MIRLFFSLILVSVPAWARFESCKAWDYERGLKKDASQQAISCYQSFLSPQNSKLDEAFLLNRISYLQFFRANHEDQGNAFSLLETANQNSEKAALFWGPWLDEEQYLKLASSERRTLSESLYFYGTGIARLSELQGTTQVVAKWPEIQKIMKMIFRLGHPDIFGFGAHRTLAIANARIPAPFGDKKLSEQYFRHAIKNSDRGGLSSYPANHNFFAELLFRVDRYEEACEQLNLVKSMTDQDISTKIDSGLFDGYKERKFAQEQFINKCPGF